FCLYVRCEDVAVIARIEQDALAGNLYERGEAPVLSHRSVLAERIVEDRDTVRPGSGRRSNCGGRHQHDGDCACQKQLHELCHYEFLLLLHAKSFWLARKSIIKFCRKLAQIRPSILNSPRRHVRTSDITYSR